MKKIINKIGYYIACFGYWIYTNPNKFLYKRYFERYIDWVIYQVTSGEQGKAHVYDSKFLYVKDLLAYYTCYPFIKIRQFIGYCIWRIGDFIQFNKLRKNAFFPPDFPYFLSQERLDEIIKRKDFDSLKDENINLSIDETIDWDMFKILITPFLDSLKSDKVCSKSQFSYQTHFRNLTPEQQELFKKAMSISLKLKNDEGITEKEAGAELAEYARECLKVFSHENK